MALSVILIIVQAYPLYEITMAKKSPI